MTDVRLLNSSIAAPATAVAVEFRLSLTNDANESFPNRAAAVVESTIVVLPPLIMADTFPLLTNDEGENRGANQSPLRSTKQRSDHWQEDVKRINSKAEQ
ncbi:hypothetical protein TCE0_039r13244 [Talaromyces pinophilus]|jgi:hypothetical protein|uniref:Uncharacterized protein n=1 Tax=Talaromyces pinophilus TaxID=128442 RepID=A0A6N4SLU8_TALPI|nr:hypothetical protein TCE0_039r13244 [Talaromyces pinophilus]